MKKQIPLTIPEIDVLFLNKKSMNNGRIFFDDKSKAKEFVDILKQNNVSFVSFVWIINDVKYYGFRIFRIKKQFLNLMENLAQLLSKNKKGGIIL